MLRICRWLPLEELNGISRSDRCPSRRILDPNKGIDGMVAVANGDRSAGTRPTSNMTDEMTPRTEAEAISLDRVQRILASILIVFVMGMISAVLAMYLVLSGKDHLARSDIVGLWGLTGLIGLLSTGMILMLNRRKPYNPLIVLGLVPMAASWYWLFH